MTKIQMTAHKNLVYSVLCGLVGYLLIVVLNDYVSTRSFEYRRYLTLFLTTPFGIIGLGFAVRGLIRESAKVLLVLAFALNLYLIWIILVLIVVRLIF